MNRLPSNIQQACSIHTFKSMLKPISSSKFVPFLRSFVQRIELRDYALYKYQCNNINNSDNNNNDMLKLIRTFTPENARLNSMSSEEGWITYSVGYSLIEISVINKCSVILHRHCCDKHH